MLPILPVFIKTIIDSETYVGYFYSAMSVAMIIAGFASTFLFKKFSRMQVISFFFVIAAFSTMFLSFVTNFSELFFLSFLKVFSFLLITTALALMVRDYTASNKLAETEGIYFTFNNIGWLLGPITGGIIARYVGAEPVFMFSGLCFFVALFYLSHQKFIKLHPALHVAKSAKCERHTWSRIKGLFGDRSRGMAYVVVIFLMMWASFRSVVVPLFIADMGYGSDFTGLVMSLSIVPFLLFEVPVSEYASKHGLRKVFVCGFAIIGIMLLAVFISPFFMLSALLLILGNIGTAFIEPLYDLFFFRHVSRKEEDEYYGIFITADPIGRFIGPILISSTLLILPFSYLFIVFGMVFFLAAGFCTFIRD